MRDAEHAGRTVVVTGAGGGIGRGAAMLFAQQGAAVVCGDIDLAAMPGGARIDHRGDRAVRVAQGERQQIERADPDHRQAQRLGDRLGCGKADAHAREQPRPDIDRDRTELADLDVGLLAHELDRGDERFRMTPPA
mgnify:CR=1 FL=1